MKSKLTLLLLCFASITFAQYGYPYGETGFGVGVGYNLISVVGKEMHPVEISLGYRINDEHLLRLYAPIFQQTNTFKSDGSNEGVIKTSLILWWVHASNMHFAKTCQTFLTVICGQKPTLELIILIRTMFSKRKRQGILW